MRASVAQRILHATTLLDDAHLDEFASVALNDRGVHLSKTIELDGVGDQRLLDLLESATFADTECTLALDANALQQVLDLPEDVSLKLKWTVALTVRTCHNGQKRILHPDTPIEPNPTLVTALVNAHRWYQSLSKEASMSIAKLARASGRDARYVKRLLTLVYLSPEIKRAILDGTQPAGMTLQKLTKTEAMPLEFAEQRSRWGMDG